MKYIYHAFKVPGGIGMLLFRNAENSTQLEMYDSGVHKWTAQNPSGVVTNGWKQIDEYDAFLHVMENE